MKNLSKHKIAVMLVANSLEFGGAETVIYNLITSLDQNKFKPYLCCLNQTGELGDLLQKQGFQVYSLNSRKGMDILLPFRLAKLFNSLGIRIAHTHTSTALKHTVVASMLSSAKIIIQTRHGDELTKRATHNSLIYQILSQRADKIVTICDHLKSKIKIQNKSMSAKLLTIHNGVDTQQLTKVKVDSEKKRLQLGIAKEDFLIVNVANIRPEKGQDTLIHAFSNVAKEFINTKLLIVGGAFDIGLFEQLKRTVKELGVSGKVIFAGKRADVPEILSCADMFVLSSVTEGLPMSLLEAMAVSKPIAATNVGGISEVIKDKFNGILIKSGSVEELSKAIKFIIANKEQAEALALQAQKTVEDNFSTESMAKKYESLYDGLLAAKIKNKTRVLVVGVIPPPIGGMSIYIKELLSSSLNKQYQLIHFDISKKTSQNRPLLFGIVYQIYLVFKLIYVLIIKNPQIIHIHTCSYFTFWRNVLDFFIARIIFRKKIILQIHGASFERFYNSTMGIKKFIMQTVLKSTDCIIVLSKYWKDFLNNNGYSHNVAVVFNGISTENYQSHYSARWNRSVRNNINILFVGNIGIRKGIVDIQKAAQLVNSKNNNFILAGRLTGEYTINSESKNIRFIGEISGNEKYRCFQDADIFILPSYAENLPLVILEAMTSGLPVIATKVGGIPELIKDGENGFLINSGDYQALAEKINYLIELPEVRKTMGKLNRDIAIEKYDFSRVVENLDRIYLSLVS